MSEMSYLEKLLDGVDVEWLSLGSIAVIKTGQSVNKKMISDNSGKYPVINSGRAPLGFIDTWNTDDDPIGITTRGAGVGSITWQDGRYFRGNLNYSVTIKKDCSIKVRYMYHLLLQMQKDIQELCTFDGIPALNASNLKRLQIPIPCPDTPEKSLAIQSEIVRILDKFTALTAELTAELTARKKQYNYYRDQLLSFDEEQEKPIYLEKLLDGAEVEWKTLGSIAELKRGTSITKKDVIDGTIPVVAGGRTPAYYHNTSNRDGQTIVIAGSGAYAGFVSWWEEPIFVSDAFTVKPHNILLPRYCYHFLMNMQQQLHDFKSGGGVPHVYPRDVSPILIPIPCPANPEKSLAIQSEIVRILDKFDTLTNSITEGLPREIELRQKQYEYYRDLLFSFPKPDSVTN